MPLKVKTQAEPFTDYSKGPEPILAKSDEYEQLRSDLARYTNGEIQGRSYLIAGHRGSGKTMLVHAAIENLLRRSQSAENRPLFVRLHGPDLLPPLTEDDRQPEKPKEREASTTVTKEGKTAADSKLEAAKKAMQAEAVQRTAADKELEAVLTQMVKALYRDVSTEYRRCYRETILRLSDGTPRDELLEVAAQFDFELTDHVTPARLRTFWRRIGAFRRGILFTADRSRYKLYSTNPDEPAFLNATDIGFQEILVLSFLSEAFRITSGTLEDIYRELDADKDARTTSISTAYELKNLFAPLAGLLSGGFVGVAIGSNNPFSAVLLGLLTGAIVSFVFSYKSERSRNRESSLESVFKKDHSVPTLSSVVPLLVTRLKQIGLAPIFVIDELDKVVDLEVRMTNLVRHLKFLVTENSFSCFLTDRRYFSYLNRQAAQTAYAREYTYFSDRLLVIYRPSELRSFVTDLLEIVTVNPPPTLNLPAIAPGPDTEQQEAQKIAYALLCRARMHPIDLRRQINPLTAKTSFSMADFFPSPRYRFEILMQVAIEWLLDGDDVKTRLSGNSHYRQVVYDALYYVCRLWEDAGSDKPQVPGFRDFKANPNERKPGLVLDDKYFAEYLESRSAAEHVPNRTLKPDPVIKTTPGGKKVEQTSGKDFEFLIGKVRELLRFLCHPEDLISEITRSQRTDKPPGFILNEIPKNKALRLIIQENDKPNYRWLYDASGTYLHTREVLSITEDVGDAIAYIREFMAALNALGLPGDFVAIADAKIIPRPSELKKVVLPALDQLDKLSADGNAYGNMIADRDAVKEFEDTLDEFEPNIKAALLCAALFAPEVALSAPSSGAKLALALQHVSTTLQLSAIAEEDLRKLKSLLASAPGPVANYDQEFDQVISSVSQRLKENKVSDETAKDIVVRAWDVARERFSKHFQDGSTSFDPDYTDVFTALRRTGPGYELASDFSTITARTWSKLLLRSLSGNDLPPWLAVAAALEVGMFELAAKLAFANDPLTNQWVLDLQRRVPADTGRHNALVLALDSESITESWKPSVRNGGLVLTVKEFAELMTVLAQWHVVTPTDYAIHLIAIELRGNLPTLKRIAGLNPASVVTTISKITPKKDFETFLHGARLSYFAAEQFTSTSVLEALLISAPKTVDELVDVSFGNPSTTTPS